MVADVVFYNLDNDEFFSWLLNKVDYKAELVEVSSEVLPDGELVFNGDFKASKVAVVGGRAWRARPHIWLNYVAMLSHSLKVRGVSKVVAVMPYLPYSRQDKVEKGLQPFSAKWVADLLQVSGIDSVLTLSLHSPQIVGFYNIPIYNLDMQDFVTVLLEKYLLEEITLVSPDAGMVKTLVKIARGLRQQNIVTIFKERLSANKIRSVSIHGKLSSKTALIVDDMVASGGTLTRAAHLLRQHGAEKVYAFATHPVLTKSIEKIIDPKEPVIDQFYFIDTILPKINNPLVSYLDVSAIIADKLNTILGTLV